MANPALTSSDVDSIMDQFPETFTASRRARELDPPAVHSCDPLTRVDIASVEGYLAAGSPNLPDGPPTLKAIRHSHIRLAQLMAGGMDDTRAAILCNYSPSRVAILKSDPTFQHLLATFANEVQEEFSDFVSAAATLSMDFLHRLQEKLDEAPESFTPALLLEAVKTLADRSGNAPISRTVSASVSVNMGDRLKLARERAAAHTIEHGT